MPRYKTPFHKFIILNNYEINNQSNYDNLIPKAWQLILISDGSFTKTLTSLTGQKTQIDILSQYTYQLINSKKKEKYG